MPYLMIELLIVATALILFVISFCSFLQKWRLYMEGTEEENAQNNANNSENSKDIDVNNQPPSYDCTFEIDLPPRYDEAVKMPQLTNDVVLQVQNLPQSAGPSEGRVQIV